MMPLALARLENLWDVPGLLCNQCAQEKDRVFDGGDLKAKLV